MNKSELITILKNSGNEEKLEKMNKKNLLDKCHKLGLIKHDDTDITKLSKKDMLNDISIYFLKRNVNYDYIYKLSKINLIKIIHDNEIPHITQEILEKEIIEYEAFNRYRDIIFYNYCKYKKVPLHLLVDIDKKNSDDLMKIINDFELIIPTNDFEYGETIMFIKSMFNTYRNYCIRTNRDDKSNNEETLPNLIACLNQLISST